MSDNDERRAALAEMVAASASAANAMKERAADELRARRAARLAGPDAALWRALYGVQQPTPKPRKRKRKPTLVGVARQAARAGEVASYTPSFILKPQT